MTIKKETSYEFYFGDETEEFVELDIDEVIGTCILLHQAVKDFDEVVTIAEDIYGMGSAQSDQFFGSFTGIILAGSEAADEPIAKVLNLLISKLKDGTIVPIEFH